MVKTAKSQLKRVSLHFRAALSRGYRVDPAAPHFRVTMGDQPCRRRGYGTSYLLAEQLDEVTAYVKAQRALGRDVVAVTHGYNFPEPDLVGTRIYVKDVKE